MPVQLGLKILEQLTTTPYKLYRTTIYVSLAAQKLHQQTTYITKHKYSHYKSISTCEGHNFWPQPVQILITQLHRASKRPSTPQALYTGLLNTIPQHSSSLIYTHFTNIAIQKHSPNIILDTPPPEIHHSGNALPRADRVHLSELRCGHHTALATYRKRIDESVDEVCTHCSTDTYSLAHIMTHCSALTHIRAQHNLSSPLDLWHYLANCLLFLRG